MSVVSESDLPSPPPAPSYRSRVVLAFSIVLAGVLLYLSIRKLDWHEVWQSILQCRLPLLAFSIAISAAAYFCRGLRWRVLLNTQQKLPVMRVFWASSAGYLGNNVLPARAGELVRTAMVSSQSHLSKTFVLTTALAERLMDAVVLILAGTIILRSVPNKPAWLQRISVPLLALGCGIAVLLLVIPLLERSGKHVARKLPLAEKLSQKVQGVIEHIAAGVRSFHDPASFAKFLLLTMAIWTLDAYSAVVLAHSMGMGMTPSTALLLIVALAMGSSLPSTPGYIGIYQFVAVTVLAPFGFTRAQAIAFIVVAQASALVLTGILGGVGLLQYRRMGSPKLER